MAISNDMAENREVQKYSFSFFFLSCQTLQGLGLILSSSGHNSEEGLSCSLAADQGRGEQPIEHEPSPAFSEKYGEVDLTRDGFGTKARVASVCSFNLSHPLLTSCRRWSCQHRNQPTIAEALKPSGSGLAESTRSTAQRRADKTNHRSDTTNRWWCS